jgi:peroxiredoxin
MRKLLWITLPASLLIAGAGFYLNASKPPGTITSDSYNFAGPRHPVTKEMEVEAGGKAGNRAPEFSLPDQDGKTWTLKDLTKNGPVVLVMTMDGCPCSKESQPFFNQIARALKGKVAFAGIFNEDQTTAKLYGNEGSLDVPYPLLCETTEKTYKAYDAEQSVYTYLIDQNGIIFKVWPGYNAAMLTELTQAAASLAKVDPPVLDFKEATEELSSGCFFFSPEKNPR